MDLLQAAWMVRNLGQPVSALKIDKNQSIIAGGWNGLLRKWDSEGDCEWSVQCSDRIESIMCVGEDIFVTSGLDIACVRNGEIRWSQKLEGSADLLEFHDGKIVSTSSVYDIEHGDFMESGIWEFTLDGELKSVTRIDEKPWYIYSGKELILGLGRPRCGAIFDSEHRVLATNSPVTCGVASKSGVIFGHADGTMSNEFGEELIRFQTSIESISFLDGMAVAMENGDLVFLGKDNKKLWDTKGNIVSTHTLGFDNLHWCGRWNGLSGTIEVRAMDGKKISELETSRPRTSCAIEDRVVFGFESGEVILWEKSLFIRRRDSNTTHEESHNSDLAAKLRSLRK
ncbi:MAG: hypothetical protein CMB16_04210 [Euryarchaeota archaeon]|nr:hypothetical protein [Euryarchaeota archaeon]